MDRSTAWMRRVAAGVFGALILGASPAGADESEAFRPRPCPPAVAETADCHEARGAAGAWVLAAVPRRWNRRLVVHAHGGPRLSEPQAGDSDEDLERFAAVVQAGYAWVGSTYRRGGYGVRMAAADADNSRRLFWGRWGRPERTILHGQSWGGNVAAKAAELHALDTEGRPLYDGVMTTNGVLFGGAQAYQFRADLRAVYQYYCRNHPGPDERAYPLWQGLPADSRMTRAELRRRVDRCLCLDREASRRTAGQSARLADILAVTGVSEATLFSHLAWGTFHFQDLVHRRLGGANPFANADRIYSGSSDDVALNAGVERFQADPAAVARLAYDADLSGLIVLPMIAVHARGDPVVSPAALDAYARTAAQAGRDHLFAPILTDESDHSRLAAATYMSVLLGLERWIDTGRRPDASALQDLCARRERDSSQCRFIRPFD